MDQRMEALIRANEVRTARAELKRELARGERKLFPLLLDPPPCIANARLEEILEAVPTLGKKKTRRVLARTALEGATVRELNRLDRQRLWHSLRSFPALCGNIGFPT